VIAVWRRLAATLRRSLGLGLKIVLLLILKTLLVNLLFRLVCGPGAATRRSPPANGGVARGACPVNAPIAIRR
jgi:hypothetical protein